MERIGSINKALVKELVDQAATELQQRAPSGPQMHSGSAQIVEHLSPELATRIQVLIPAARAMFDAEMSKKVESFFQGIGELGKLAEPQRVNWDQIDFSNASIGMPNPTKAMRITIDMPAGFEGPDALVYPARYFETDAAGNAIPRSIEIGSTHEVVQIRPGDPILDAWSGSRFEGKGFLVWNDADSMPVPIPASGKATQILVNRVNPDELAKMKAIFGGRDPGTLSQAELKIAFTRVANEVSKDIYLAEAPSYAKNNLDPIDVAQPGIGLHSKKENATWAVRFDGPLEFNSPFAGSGVQSFPEGAVLIRTTVKGDDGELKTVVRGIKPEAYDADGYQAPDGTQLTFATLPKAVVRE